MTGQTAGAILAFATTAASVPQVSWIVGKWKANLLFRSKPDPGSPDIPILAPPCQSRLYTSCPNPAFVPNCFGASTCASAARAQCPGVDRVQARRGETDAE